MADNVAISNCSSLFFASLLNKNASGFFWPDITQSGLIQFNPWNSKPSMNKKLPPAQHKYLKSVN
jgi:hypothetical protein